VKQKTIVTDKISRSDLKTEVATTVEATEIESRTHSEASAKIPEKTAVISRTELRREKTELIRMPVDGTLSDFQVEADHPSKSRPSLTPLYGFLIALIVVILILLAASVTQMLGAPAQEVAKAKSQPSVPANDEKKIPNPDTFESNSSPPKDEETLKGEASMLPGEGEVAPMVNPDSKRAEDSNTDSNQGTAINEKQTDDSTESLKLNSSSKTGVKNKTTRKKKRVSKRKKGKRSAASARRVSAPKGTALKSLTTKEKLQIVRQCRRSVPCRKDIMTKASRLKAMSIAELRAFPSELDACVQKCARK
jgi:hypothetical protein